MNAPEQHGRDAPLLAISPRATALLFAAVAAATTAAAVTRPQLAPVPAVLAGLLLAVFTVPLRWSASALVFMLLAIDSNVVEGTCPHDLACRWRTPLVVVGDLLHGKLPGLPVTGMEVALGLLLVVRLHRVLAGSRIDEEGRAPWPSVLTVAALLYVAAVLFADLNGVARGGEVAPWKLRNLLHPILLLIAFQASYRGPRDHELIARVLVAAACTRAMLAIVIQAIAVAQTGGPLESGTSHGDSVLFSLALFALIAELMERSSAHRVLRAALLGGLLGWGMVKNDRRLAWVMVAMMLGVAYLVSPWRGWKRSLTRLATTATPIIALYLAVGWSSTAFVFRPVQTFRSVIDTSADHSSFWREVENWNIIMSMREDPLFGLGLGRSYTEHMANDDISSVYEEYRQWPHNSVLGMLLFFGLPAFSMMWTLAAVGTFLAARAYRFATDPADRAAALTALAGLIGAHVLAWGDTGAHFPQFKIVFALSLAVAGKLATATGAWPALAARRASDAAEAAEAARS